MVQILNALSRLPAMAKIAMGVALCLGLGSLYVSSQAARNPEAAACAAAGALGPAVGAAAIGEVAAFQPMKASLPVPPLRFLDPAGQPTGLAEMRGKTVLLNLWATWCAPCRKEMPALDALQREMGGPDFEVVAINIDTRNLERPREWLREAGVEKLAYYADPEAKVFQELKRVGQAVGMPTTLLIDAKGCQLGVLHGPAEWASDDAKRLIRAALRR